MIWSRYELSAAAALSVTARPVVLNPVITPSAKNAHTTSPPIRALHPATALFPPRTAPRHLNPTCASPVADQPNLRFKPDAALLFHLVARHLDQRAHFRSLCAAKIHNKIRMLIRKRRAAKPRPFQTSAFQQLAGKIPRRIFENRSRIRHAARLPRRTFRLELRDSRRQSLAIAVRKLEIDSSDDEMIRQLGASIGKLDVVLRQRDSLSCFGDAMHQRDHLRDLAAERTRVHHQSAPNRAWNSFAEFEPLKTSLNHRLHQGPKRSTCAGNDARAVNFYLPEAIPESHHQPAHAPIADEQVGSRAEAEARHTRAICRRLRMHQLAFILDCNEQIGRPANPKRSELCQWHRGADSRAEFRAQLALKRLHELLPRR